MQVGKLLSESLRDAVGPVGRMTTANGDGDQGRWHKELGQLSMELMAVSDDICMITNHVLIKPYRHIFARISNVFVIILHIICLL